MACKPITDQQVKLYFSDLQTQSQRTAAARAGFSERTARRIDADPTLPSNRKIAHGRTVADPLARYWEADLLAFVARRSRCESRVNLDEKVPLVVERWEGGARAGFHHQRWPGFEGSGDRVIAVGQSVSGKMPAPAKAGVDTGLAA